MQLYSEITTSYGKINKEYLATANAAHYIQLISYLLHTPRVKKFILRVFLVWVPFLSIILDTYMVVIAKNTIYFPAQGYVRWFLFELF